ncbi:MAG: hypothetical protein ABI811_17550 [Acidobacteriota bacterium]
MTFARASRLAAAASGLLGVVYLFTSGLPLLTAEGSLDFLPVAIAVHMILAQALWVWYFQDPGQRRAAVAVAALAVAPQVAFAITAHAATFSFLSLDSMVFVFGTLFPSLCWLAILLRGKIQLALQYLFLFLLFMLVLQVSQAGGSIYYWREAPWRLIAGPAISIFHVITQALYVRAYLPKA